MPHTTSCVLYCASLALPYMRLIQLLLQIYCGFLKSSCINSQESPQSTVRGRSKTWFSIRSRKHKFNFSFIKIINFICTIKLNTTRSLYKTLNCSLTEVMLSYSDELWDLEFERKHSHSFVVLRSFVTPSFIFL